MYKLVGQALWIVESGAKLIDSNAQLAVCLVLRNLEAGNVVFSTHPDVHFGERAKAEVLIGPPPVPGQILDCAIWYRRRINDMTENHRPMGYAGQAVRFDPPDVDTKHEYFVDIYADGNEVLWIDVIKVHPSQGPRTVLEAMAR